jgi:WD40 repeat protein
LLSVLSAFVGWNKQVACCLLCAVNTLSKAPAAVKIGSSVLHALLGLCHQVHAGGCCSLSFQPHGHLVASCGLDKTVQTWDLNTNSHVHTYHVSNPTQHAVLLRCCCFSQQYPAAASITAGKGQESSCRLNDGVRVGAVDA